MTRDALPRQALRDWRQSKGLTQSQAAELMGDGWDGNRWGNMERGIPPDMRGNTIIKVMRVTGLSWPDVQCGK